MKEYLFAYGVFRDTSRKLLGNYSFCGKANISGKLYRVDDFYPGFISMNSGKVWGDVYLIDPSILPQLDEFEGSEFLRKKVTTSMGVECWVYEYKHDITEFKEIDGGDWMLR